MNGRRPAIWVMVFAAAAAARARAADAPRGLENAPVAQRELWRQGSGQMLSGDFEGAARTLAHLKKDLPNDQTLQHVQGWADQAIQLTDSREKLRQRIYDKHSTKALEQEKLAQAAEKTDKKEKDKKDESLKAWSESLSETYRAYQNAANEDKFRGEAWVQRILGECQKKADQLRQNSEWRDAYVYYETLRQIAPDTEIYKQRSRECRQHAHFETFFTPKGEWKTELRGIDPDVVKEILGRVSMEYVTEVDFKKLCISGLENVILLSKTNKLDKVFPALGDKDRVGDFNDRVSQQLGRVRNRTRFDYRDMSNVFDRVLKINRETVTLPEAVLVDEFFSGAFEPLDDFTSIIWPSEVDEFTKHTRGEFVGVGIQITKEAGSFIRVESPLEDTPAYEAGVEPGEMITAVDGRSTVDVNVNDAVRLITGEPGTKVTLTIKGLNGVERKVTLKRRKIKLYTVRGASRCEEGGNCWNYMIDADRKIGYVRVNSFMEQTVDDLRTALEQLQNTGCKGLIIDLRFNPGGLLRSAVDVCNLFLDEGEPIVQTKGRSGRTDMDIEAKGGAGFRNWPIIILVNEYSASASEIVAGALSGRHKAFIVGSRSYGKGSVQNLIPIDDNAAYLKLTTQHYYVPTSDREEPWRCLHRNEGAKVWGVDPDIEVKLVPYEVAKVLRLRRKADVLSGKGKGPVASEVLEHRRSNTTQPANDEDDDTKLDPSPEIDPQLLTALNVMRMKLLSHQPWVYAPRPTARGPVAVSNEQDRPAQR